MPTRHTPNHPSLRCPRCLGPTMMSGTCPPCERAASAPLRPIEDSLFTTAAALYGVALDDLELVTTRPSEGLWLCSLRLVPDADPCVVGAPCSDHAEALRSLAVALHARALVVS